MQNDLATFFKNKDKKKKSKKAQTFTPADLMRKIELDAQGAPDVGYDSSGDGQTQKVVATATSLIKDDEEWEMPDANKEIDLSALKIQNLGEKEKRRQEVEERATLEQAVIDSKTTMKWDINKREDSDDDEPDEEEQPAKTDENAGTVQSSQPPSSTTSNAYVPPSLRNAAPARTTAASGITLERISIKRGPLHQNIDVNSTEQFPSLGVANEIHSQNSAWGSAAANKPDGAGFYTPVRRGVRGAQEGGHEHVETANKFSALKRNGN